MEANVEFELEKRSLMLVSIDLKHENWISEGSIDEWSCSTFVGSGRIGLKDGAPSEAQFNGLSSSFAQKYEC